MSCVQYLIIQFLHHNELLQINAMLRIRTTCRNGAVVMDIIRNIYHLITNSLLYFMEHTNLIVDIIKNTPDLILPLPSLGYIETAQQFMSFCGVIFSEAAVCQILNPKLWLWLNDEDKAEILSGCPETHRSPSPMSAKLMIIFTRFY